MPNDTIIDLALTILDPDLCAELSKRPEGEQRNEFAITLMKIGSLALREAQGRNDADRVRAERERLIKNTIKALDERQEAITTRSGMNQLSSETPRAIAIDWSGAQEPNKNIWAAVAVGPRLEALQMKKSREDAIDWLIEQLKQQPNTIAGLDFAFSMPAWFVREYGCENAIKFWAVVEKEGEKWLKFCRNPFWGKEGTKMPRDCELFRETEKAVRKANPKSTFQIRGGGQVGMSSIRGMPFLTQLRREGIAVWPFDELKRGRPAVVDIYPRLLIGNLTNSDRVERIKYLEDHYPNMKSEHRDCAEKYGDAFDAAVSALALVSTWGATPPPLPNAKLEGQIWL